MVDVLVVDDNEIERAGRELVLRRHGHRVEAIDWATARTASTSAEVVLAVVRRDPAAFDRWDRLRRAGGFRRLGRPGARVMALTSDPNPISPIARLRLVRAGADGIFTTGDLSTGVLLDAVVRVTRPRASAPRVVIGRVAVGRDCDPRAVVEHVLAKAATDPAYLRAFEPGTAQNASGLSRRRAHTLRVKVAALGDLTALTPASGGEPRDLSLPRWTDMVSFVNLCRVWSPDDADVGFEAPVDLVC
ncbi:MAG: hypothetical protein KF906_00110 [Actinobacteria bacterium]|nr:hypothetical protein [Actinomycetota bacterium]